MWLALRLLVLLMAVGSAWSATSYYFDIDGATPGFGAPSGSYNESGGFWSTSSAGTDPTSTLPTDTVVLNFGNSSSDFAGRSFTIFADLGPNTSWSGLTIAGTSTTVTLSGFSNFYLDSNQTWSVPAGSTFNESEAWNGEGLNVNAQSVLLVGGGTINFTTAIGLNGVGSAPIVENGSGMVVNLSAAAGGVQGSDHQSSFTLQDGTLNFANAASANAFNRLLSSQSGNLTFSGGTLDNTSGSAMTLDLYQGVYNFTGSFAFTGSSSLDLGPAAVTLTTTPTITVAAGTLTISGSIGESGGSQGLIKAGAGTLTSAAANTYTGATTVNAGVYSLVNDIALSSSSLSIASGAVLEFNVAGGIVQPLLTLNGAGTLRKTGAGLLYFGSQGNIVWNFSAGALIDIQQGSLCGGSSVQDFWTTNLASLNIASGSAFQGVEANVRVDALTGGGTFTCGYPGAGYINDTIGVNNGSGTFSGVIADEYDIMNLVKEGTGTQTLSGANTYTGTTTISGGTLLVTGSLAAGSAVTVANTATLAGSGTVAGTVALSAGATLAPGTGGTTIATLSTGAVTCDAASVFSVDLNGTGPTADRVTSSGVFTCAGTLTVASIANPVAGRVYTIASGSSVSGTFAGLANGAVFISNGSRLQIAYTATTVTLTDVHPTTRTWDGGGGDNNWTTAANWDLDVTPLAGDDLVFAGSTRLAPNNDFTAGTSFNTITFSAGAGNFAIGGNALVLAGGASALASNATSGTMTVNTALTFSTAAPTVTSTAGGTLAVGGTVANGGFLLTVAAAGPTSLGGVVSGTGGLTKSGVGSMTLTAADTYSGMTTVTAGTLTESGGSIIGTLGLITQSGGTFVLASGTVTLASDPTGVFGVGFGAVGTGTVIVNGGALNVGNGGGLTFVGGGNGGPPLGTGILTVAGGTVTIAAPGSFPNDMVYLAGYGGMGTINLDGGTLSTARRIKDGVGGGSIVNFNGGLLQVALSESFFDNCGTLNVRNGGALIDTQGFGVLINTAFTHSALGGDLATDGGMTKSGSGTLTLGTSNTYNGSTQVNAGTLLVTGSTASGSAVTVANTATLGGSGTVAGTIALSAGGTLAPGTGSTSIATLGTGAVTCNATSVFSVDLDGAGPTADRGTSSGVFTCAGTLTVASIANAALGKVYTIASGSSVSGTFAGLANSAFLSSNGRIFQIAYTATTVTLTDVAHPTTRTWDGGGADNNWTTAANWDSDIAPQAGDDLVFAGSTRLAPNNDFTAGTSFNSITFSSGAGNFTLGGNALILAGGATALASNAISGTMTVNTALTFSTAAPTITATAGGALAVGGTVANGGFLLTVAAAGPISFGAVVSGGGGLTKTGADTLTSTAVNTYTGTTTVSAGVYSLGNNTRLASTALSIASGAVLEYNVSSSVGQTTLTMTGAGTLRKTGAGTLFFGGNGTVNWNFSAGALIDVQQGTLVGGSSTQDDWTNDLASMNIASGAVFSGVEANVRIDALTGAGTFSGGYVGAGYATDTIGVSNGSGTFTGVIQDFPFPMLLTKVGTGTQTLSGANTYTGGTTISAGALKMGAAGVMPSTGSVLLTGTLDLGSFSQTIGALAGTGIIDNTVSGTPTLTVGQGNSSGCFSGIIRNTTGTVSLTKAGTGNLLLLGTSTYSGATVISAGTLSLDGAPITANLLYQLDASSSSNYTLTSGKVSTWTDLSGHGNHFTGASGPTVSAAAIHGLDALAFTTSSTLTLNTSTSPNTVFIVNNVTAFNGFDGILGLENGDHGIRLGSATFWGQGNGSDFNGGGGAIFINGVGGSTFVPNTPHLLEVYASGGAGTPWAATTLDNYFHSFNRPWVGTIGEILVYSTALSTSDRQAVEAYLLNKWVTGTPGSARLPTGTVLQIAASGTLELGGTSPTVGSLAGSGGTAGTVTNNGPATATLTAGDATSTTFAGVIQDGAQKTALTKAGAGTLTLSGTNTATGAVTVSGGTLLVSGATAAGSAVAVANTATLAGTGTVAGTITLGAGGTLAPGTGGTTISTLTTGAVTGNATSTYSVDLNGTGPTADRCTSSGAVTCAGTLTVASLANAAVGRTYTIASGSSVSGTFTGLANGAAFAAQGRTFQIVYGASAVTLADVTGVAPATRTWNGGGSDNNWTTAANWVGGVTPLPGDDLVFAGTTRLAPNNDFTAGTTFDSITFSSGAGDFVIGGNALILPGSASVLASNATSGTMTINTPFTFTTAAPTVTSTAGGTLALGGTIDNGGFLLTVAAAGPTGLGGIVSGAGGLTKSGAGTLTLTGANTYAGATAINAGTLEIGSGGTVNAASTITVADTATLKLSRNDTWGVHTTTTSSPIIVNAGGTLASNGSFNTVVNLTLNGGTVTLNGGVNATFPALALKGTVTVGGSQASAINAGTGSFNAILVGTNAAAGITTFAVADATSSSAADLAINVPMQDNVNPALNAFVASGFTKTGAGTLTLSQNSTFTSLVTVSAGTLATTTANSLTGAVGTASGVLIQSGATVTVGGFNSFVGAATSGTKTIQIDAGGTLSTTGAITSHLHAVVLNGGTISADTPVSDWTSWNLDFGVSTLGGGTSSTISGGNVSLTQSGGTTFTIASGDTVTVSSVVEHATAAVDNGLIKSGAGTLTLSGVNTYTSATTVNAGTLKAGVGTQAFGLGSAVTLANTAGVTLDLTGFSNTIGSLAGGGGTGGTVTLGGGATLTMGVDNTSTTYAGGITGNGGITKAGSGTLTLSGTDAATGGVTVAPSGTLLVTGSTAAASAVTVLSSATLGGTGTVAGTVLVGNGGTLSPGVGVAGIGTLTTGAMTLSSSSTTTVDLDGTTPSSDCVAVAGAVVRAGALTVASNANAAAGKVYTILTSTSASGTFSGLADGALFAGAGRLYRIAYTATTVTLTDCVPVVTARQTIDANGDGHLDRIRLTFDQALNDDFTGFTATVAGYTVTTYDTGATPNDASIDVLVTPLAGGDTGATPVVCITANTSLKQVLGAGLVPVEGSGTAATDAAAPVLLSAAWTDGGTGGFGVGDTVTLTFSETVTVASMTVADLGLPVTSDTLSSTPIVDQSGSAITMTLAGTPLLTPGGTYSAAALGAGKPSGVFIASGSHIQDAVALAPATGSAASAVDLGPTTNTVAIAWASGSDPRTWALGTLTLGTVANSITSGIDLTVRDVGDGAVDLVIASAATAPSSWAPAASAGANTYLMKADASGAATSAPTVAGSYPLTLTAATQALSSGLLSGATMTYALYFQAPTSITSGSATLQTIAITVTASLAP